MDVCLLVAGRAAACGNKTRPRQHGAPASNACHAHTHTRLLGAPPPLFYWSRFGTVTSCDIIRDFKTGDSLSYAFVGARVRARVCGGGGEGPAVGRACLPAPVDAWRLPPDEHNGR